MNHGIIGQPDPLSIVYSASKTVTGAENYHQILHLCL